MREKLNSSTSSRNFFRHVDRSKQVVESSFHASEEFCFLRNVLNEFSHQGQATVKTEVIRKATNDGTAKM